MKVSKRDIYLLVGFLGIAAAVCTYFFLFQPTTEKTEALEAENARLQSRIMDLSGKMNNKETYESETVRMNQEMEEIFQLFPVDVREEDGILLAINQELLSPMEISNISITAREQVAFQTDEEQVEHTYEIEQVEQLEAQEGTSDVPTGDNTTVNDAGTGSASMPNVLMQRNVTTNYIVSYDGLKRSIKNIGMQTNRMTINNLTVSYDESTGLLSGMTSVDMFCIPGQPDKEYVQPDFESVLLGTDNIFGTIRILGEAGLPALDGEEADEDNEGEANAN